MKNGKPAGQLQRRLTEAGIAKLEEYQSQYGIEVDYDVAAGTINKFLLRKQKLTTFSKTGIITPMKEERRKKQN